MSGLTIDKKISVGTIVQIAVLAVALIAGWLGLKFTVDSHAKILNEHIEKAEKSYMLREVHDEQLRSINKSLVKIEEDVKEIKKAVR